jgi:hypothetical protein
LFVVFTGSTGEQCRRGRLRFQLRSGRFESIRYDAGLLFFSHMRPLFLLLRVIALFVASVFTALGLLHIGFGLWMICARASLGSVGGFAICAAFGGWMTYLGMRALVQQLRLAVEWWRMSRRERGLPAARIVLR